MDELTAEKVWEMVKGIDLNEIIPDVACLRDDADGPYETVRHWAISTDYDGTLSPYQALALIVDAAKREMGEDYLGATVGTNPKNLSQSGWVAIVSSKPSRFGPTESAAVLAAWRAWKEGR